MRPAVLLRLRDHPQRATNDACELAGRDPAEVMLLPVSKNHSADAVRELTYHGCRVFGESKIQEAKLKISACPGNLEWQLIGHLQSNKCRDAVRLFRMIQSVDRMSIAEEINRHAHNAAKDMPVLLEVKSRCLVRCSAPLYNSVKKIAVWQDCSNRGECSWISMKPLRASLKRIRSSCT